LDNEIAILILFFNKVEETIACIESFIPSKQPIYILNNGSDADLWNRIQHKFCNQRQVTLFHSDTNLGVSKGRNYLIRKTTEPWLLIVDNDVTAKMPLELFNSFARVFSQIPKGKVFTLRVYNVHEAAYVKPIKIVKTERKVTIQTTEDVLTNCFPGTGSIINREIFKTHGLFDESLFVGLEDYEYALRCMQSPEGELSVFHIDDIELIHDHKFQKKKVDKYAVRERYNENRIMESYNHIVKKYDIEFDHDWEWWTRKQVSDMTGSNLIEVIKKGVAKYLPLFKK
jgi:GT2 family glycosyltransferase